MQILDDVEIIVVLAVHLRVKGFPFFESNQEKL